MTDVFAFITYYTHEYDNSENTISTQLSCVNEITTLVQSKTTWNMQLIFWQQFPESECQWIEITVKLNIHLIE